MRMANKSQDLGGYDGGCVRERICQLSYRSIIHLTATSYKVHKKFCRYGSKRCCLLCVLHIIFMGPVLVLVIYLTGLLPVYEESVPVQQQ